MSKPFISYIIKYFFFLFTILMALLIIYQMISIYYVVNETTLEQSTRTISVLAKDIEQQLSSYETLSNIIANNPTAKNIVNKMSDPRYSDNPQFIYNLREDFITSVQPMLYFFPSVYSIAIVDKSGHIFYMGSHSKSNMFESDELVEHISHPDGSVGWSKGFYTLARSRDSYICYTTKLTDNGFSTTGYFLLFIREQTIQELLEHSSLSNWNGVSLYYHDEFMAGIGDTASFEATNFNAGQSSSNSVFNIFKTNFTIQLPMKNGFYLYGILPKESNFFERQRDILWIVVIIIILYTLLTIVVIKKFARRLAAPLRAISNGIDINTKMSLDNVELMEDIYDISEIKIICFSVNQMIVGLKEKVKKILQYEVEKQKAEIKLLQSQINPHFLYNTLNAINSMLIIKGDRETSKIIQHLGDIFRYSIDNATDCVGLSEELSYVEKYLEIFKIRFANNFNYEIICEEKCLTCSLIKLIIQPIVENSIIHGIEKMAKPGFIKIDAHEESGLLRIIVDDNGPGFSEEKLQTAIEMNTHIGIQNVMYRIRYFYGDKYGLSFESNFMNGARVVFNLPYSHR